MASLKFVTPADFDASAPVWKAFFQTPGGYLETSYSSQQWALAGTAASGLQGYRVVFSGSFSRPPAGGIPTGNITGFAVYNAAGNELYEGTSSQLASAVVANPSILFAPGTSVTLTSGNDRFIGGSDNYSIAASAGSDTIIGGSGRTQIDFSALQTGVQIDLRSIAPQTVGLGILTLQNVRGVVGTAAADIITGSSGDDVIDGRGGTDIIDGGAGNDTISSSGNSIGAVIHGGAGDDMIFGNNVFRFDRGIVHGDAGNDVLTIGSFGASIYYGDDGDDVFGFAGAQITTGPLTYGSGNVLDGGSGDDTFNMQTRNKYIGGSGNDVFRGENSGAIDGGDGYDVIDTVTFGISSIYLGNRFPPGSYDMMASGIEELRVSVSPFEGYRGSKAQPLYVYGDVGDDLIIGGGTVGITFDGGGGNDRITGTGGDDAISTGSGNDRIASGLGNDVIVLGGGNDTVDGGSGNDKLVVRGNSTTYQTILAGDNYVLVGAGQQAVVTGIEQVQFDDATISWSSLAAQPAEFDGLRYIASYADLIAVYGPDAAGGLNHFLTYGLSEARSVHIFDPLRYVASNPDLARGYGSNVTAAETHYIEHGFAEGRVTTSFDPYRYLASNTDLIGEFGDDPVAATTHYIDHGLGEGRSTTAFDPYRYLASNLDLARAYGTDAVAAEQHYIQHGLAEGRSATRFDTLQYLAANTDLARGFGSDVEAAEKHYIEHGLAEGRATTGFDAIAYLLTYPDLAMAKLGPTWATEHWVLNGADEGRIGDTLFGREQTSHVDAIGTIVNDALQTGGDHDWFSLTLAAGQRVSIAMHGAGLAPALSVADEYGHAIASIVATGDDAVIDFTADHAATYYLTAYSNAGVAGAYMIDSQFI